MKLPVITAEKFAKLPRNSEGGIIAPKGDYSAFKSFPAQSEFRGTASFAAKTKFGSHCEFAGDTQFGAECQFGEGCTFCDGASFGMDCTFGPECQIDSARYSRGCVLARECVVGDFSDFGDKCTIGDGSIVGNNVSFGHKCELGEDVQFGDQILFGQGCELGASCSLPGEAYFGSGCVFGPNCDIGNVCDIGDGPTFGPGCSIEGRRLRTDADLVFFSASLGYSENSRDLRTACQFFNTTGEIYVVNWGGCGSLDIFRKEVKERFKKHPVNLHILLSLCNTAAMVFGRPEDCQYLASYKKDPKAKAAGKEKAKAKAKAEAAGTSS